jgi:ATP-dependent Clp protease ATP-binding subunit ClpA
MVKKLTVTDDDLEEFIFQYCRDYTDLERKGRFDPISGREKEIDEVILIMLQKGRKNAALLAPAGVGKTALVVGLAQKIVKKEVPNYLLNARVIEIDMSSMAAGTTGPADFQARFVPLARGAAERYHYEEYPKIILFIDEIHTIMPTCEGSSYKGLSEVMKPYLTVGDLHVLGATTLDEYRIYVKEDPALDRRFQQVPLSVPDAQETFRILQVLRGGYEKHHHTKISDEALRLVVKLTDQFMPRRNQPDKSIIIMDGACAHHVMENGWGGELTIDSIQKMVSIETKLSPKALE